MPHRSLKLFDRGGLLHYSKGKHLVVCPEDEHTKLVLALRLGNIYAMCNYFPERRAIELGNHEDRKD